MSTTIHIRVNRTAKAVHVAQREDDGSINYPACGAPGNTPNAARAFRPVVVDEAVTCKRCAKAAPVAEVEAQRKREAGDDVCADCLAGARKSARENWRDATGKLATTATAAELAEIEAWARSYVAEGLSTPCDAHKPVTASDLAYNGGYPVVGCPDCFTHAASSATENWHDDKGRWPETDAELAEVDEWARSYVAEGMTTACATHDEPPREPATVVGVVTCDDCGQRHEASYSHEGSYGEGAIYAVVCGEYVEHYTAEVVTFDSPAKIAERAAAFAPANKPAPVAEYVATSDVPCVECGGDTIPPTPGSVDEVGYYCERCGRITEPERASKREARA